MNILLRAGAAGLRPLTSSCNVRLIANQLEQIPTPLERPLNCAGRTLGTPDILKHKDGPMHNASFDIPPSAAPTRSSIVSKRG